MVTPPSERDVLVIGGCLAGATAALAAVRSGARTRLLLHGAHDPPESPAIPDDVRERAERAIGDTSTPAPEEPQLFRLRARRVTRWLDELGIENDAGWATELRGAVLDRCEREGVALDETSVAVRLIGKDKGITGAVLVDGTDCATHQADTTILAGGGAQFLWPSDHPETPPSGIALALRAELPVGDPSSIAWNQDTQAPLRLLDTVRADGRGRLATPGVAVCGEAMAAPWHSDATLAPLEDAVRGLEAGAFQGPPAPRADPELVPVVDNPMPPGFSTVKLGRLRSTLERLAGPEAPEEDLERCHAEMLSLRGEFADYARARAGTDVHLLHQAADVALAHVAARTGQSSQ